MIGVISRIINEFFHSPIEVSAAVTVIVGGVSAMFRGGRRFWANVWARVRSRPVVPRETLCVVQDVASSLWCPAKVGETAAMQVVLDGHVTDVSGRQNRILGAEIPKPLSYSVMVSLSDNHDARRPQVLGAHECAQIRVVFFVQPVVAEKGKPWRSSVVFIDQYGNRHKVKNCVFRSAVPSSPPPSPGKEAVEYVYEISSPIEKEVVAVLQAELGRYAVCGRSCGGLGSIQMVYRGHHLTGVGGDSWTANSPLNQTIVPDPEAASLKSDNLAALAAFYQGLGTDEERKRFKKALLERLDGDRGYLAVSYFVIAVLWSIGCLGEGLAKAKRDLPEGESRAYGLSNVLMLLNGLLKYRHPDFSKQMLDEIERATRGLNEHVFLIPEKIAAIRASRLSGTHSAGHTEPPANA